MFKKKNIITTSAIISLILFNASEVMADDNTDNTDTPQTTITEPFDNNANLGTESSSNSDSESIESPQSKVTVNEEKLPFDITSAESLNEYFNFLNEEQLNTIHNVLKSNELVSTKIINAIDHHKNEDFEAASAVYDEILEHSDDEIEKNLIVLLKESAEESISLNEINIEEEIDEQDSEPTEAETKEGIPVEEETDLQEEVESTPVNEPSNKPIDVEESEESVEESPQLFQAQRQSSSRTIDEYYAKIRQSNSVSERWSLALEMKDRFGADALVVEAVNFAANSNFNYAKRAHDAGNYPVAVAYYNRVINEPLVEESTRVKAAAYQRQLSRDVIYNTAEEYYTAIRQSKSISERWTLALEAKEIFKSGTHVTDGLNFAAKSNIDYARRQHQSGNYSGAIGYYNRVINEPLVDQAIRDQADAHKKQAEARSAYRTAEDYYKDIRTSGSISERWALALEAKDLFKSGTHVTEGLNFAAKSNIDYARRQHQSGNYNGAINYYNRVINEPMVNQTIRDQAVTHKTQAESRSAYRTAADYYNDIRTSGSISERWALALEAKDLFKSGTHVTEGLNFAAKSNIDYARRQHQSGNYNGAINYYNRVINEPLVDQSIRDQAALHKTQAEARSAFRTAADYYNDIRTSGSISQRWALALELKDLFPSSGYVKQAIDFAAKSNLDYGLRLHREGDLKNAINYYNRVISEPMVESSVQNRAIELKAQAENGSRFKSPNEFYNAVFQSSSVSERWSLAIEFLNAHSSNPLVDEALDFAANSNLAHGRKLHRSGNNTGARSYYNRIVNEPRVNASTRHLASIFSKQTYSDYKPTVYIDPGHGGSDPGAVSSGVTEKGLNLNISVYLKNELEKRGYNVVISRASDTFRELTERAAEANTMNADIFISVHHNSMGGSGVARGIETFIYHRVESGFGQEVNRKNFNMHIPRIDESVRLADNIHNNLIKSTGLGNRGVKGNNFNVLRNTYIPAVLLELGFMDNSTELSIIRTDSYQRKAALAVAQGVDTYFKSILK